MIFTHSCVNEDCDEQVEFELEPLCRGGRDEPPSGGDASPVVDNCPKCNVNLWDDPNYLLDVYDHWCDSNEPDEPDFD